MAGPGAGVDVDGPGPVRRGFDGLAIAALVLSIVWACGLGSVLGFALGVAAVVRIQRSRSRGAGLAVSAMVVGAAGLAFTVWLFAAISLDDGGLVDPPPTEEECQAAQRGAARLVGTLYGLDVDTGKELWRSDVGWPSSRPTVYRGRVYVEVQDVVTGIASVVALDAATGSALWKTDLGQWDLDAPIVFADDAIAVDATPAPNTFVIDAVTGDVLRHLDAWQPSGMNGEPDPGLPADSPERRGGLVIGRETISRIDPRTGDALWSTRPPSVGYVAVNTRNPITIQDVMVAQDYAAGYASTSRIYAFDRSTGRLLWDWAWTEIELPDYIQGEDRATVVPARSNSAGLTALDPHSGQRLWYAPVNVGESIVFTDDAALVAHVGSVPVEPPTDPTGSSRAPSASGQPVNRQDSLVELDPRDGHVRWAVEGADNPGQYLQYLHGTIAATEGTYDGFRIVGFDSATGERRWSLPGDHFRGPTLWRSDNSFLAATSDGRVTAFAPDGTTRWQTPPTGTITSQMDVGDGRVFYFSRPEDDEHVIGTLDRCRDEGTAPPNRPR